MWPPWGTTRIAPTSEGDPPLTATKTTSTAPLQLRRNSLGLTELVFQAITHIAPAGNIVLTFPIIAREAGPAMPVSLLLTTIVCFLIGNTVAQFSAYLPSSGGYYSFATRGLGSRGGFIATWSYLMYELLGSRMERSWQRPQASYLHHPASSDVCLPSPGGNRQWNLERSRRRATHRDSPPMVGYVVVQSSVCSVHSPLGLASLQAAY